MFDLRDAFARLMLGNMALGKIFSSKAGEQLKQATAARHGTGTC
jgi:hypothetical protein